MMSIFKELKISPEKILCTHHHIDHCSFLHLTAKHFKVPVLMHKKTFELAREKEPVIWDEIQPYIQWVNDGDEIGYWKNKKLLIHHVPGHAAGQVAVTTKDGDFFIAGDLFQSEGSVVIGGRGSSMQQYMDTLMKLVQFNPAVLYPSHGIPLGSLNPITKILKHRLIRHQEVVDLLEKGLSIEEITVSIYSEIPKELFQYARANVESHRDWLQMESLESIKKRFLEFIF